MKILVLGGTGNQGQFAMEKLIADDCFDEIIVTGRNVKKGEDYVAKLNNSKVKFKAVDVGDKDALLPLMDDADVVANCTGPFYKLLPGTIDVFLKSKCKKYIDYCDDVEAFETVITEENQKIAKEAGKQIIIGLGGSPGVIPIEVMAAAELMDEPQKVAFYMIMDELSEGGPAVWDHMLENFNGTVATWEGGKLVERKGLSVVEEHEYDDYVFPGVGKVKTYDLGHPEVYTLPKVLPNLEEIKIKCTMFPISVQEMVNDMSRIGLLENDPIQVGDNEVAPRALLLELMKKLYYGDTPGFLDPSYREPEDRMGGATTVVRGVKDGKNVVYTSSWITEMGPITSFPLAIGARMLAENKIEPMGFMIAEEAITNAGDFVKDVYDSIAAQGYFLRRKANVNYEISYI
ncbi:MAG: hypothetical protein GX219_07250 [Tissierellia bacterium]|nr:hypothetical protein [Tissierellia bacterium]